MTFGFEYQLRGHWIGRLAQIDEDIAAMAKLPESNAPTITEAAAAIRAALATPSRKDWNCSHQPAPGFRAGQRVEISLSIKDAPDRVNLHYRHVNQAEIYAVSEMQFRDRAYRGAIPAAYTESPYPLQYYFELRDASGAALYPALSGGLSNQPYFVLRRAS